MGENQRKAINTINIVLYFLTIAWYSLGNYTLEPDTKSQTDDNLPCSLEPFLLSFHGMRSTNCQR